MAQDNNSESFKQQLDREATQEGAQQQQEQQPNTLAAKITEFIPAAAKVLGDQHQQQHTSQPPARAKPGPPERPHHDDKIEEFVRDQHRSKDEVGGLQHGEGGA
ncbi:hypothetical protein XA68_12336 [Ophiocordyceps unilateralis]|uniref:Uncharacterized protein n=1 Tax=Ophiocordyceps unilateralis TaxID=268505 RepID=A0A2A9PUK9_OPHUN|nr:hypothetical protein XA68_12336 [Ophiocordyceps unilateralis]